MAAGWVIVIGHGLYGKVERIGADRYVATEFFHLFWFPVIPMRSIVVTDRRFRSWDGAKIAMSGKSVFAAYLRALCVLAFLQFLFALVTGQIRAADGGPGPDLGNLSVVVSIFLSGGVPLAVGLFTYLLPWFRRARGERAKFLEEAAAQHLRMRADEDRLDRAGADVRREGAGDSRAPGPGAVAPTERRPKRPIDFRFAVQRLETGAGVVLVSGRVRKGVVRPGDVLYLAESESGALPGVVALRGEGRPLQTAREGQAATLTVSGLPGGAVNVGDVIAGSHGEPSS
jgi:hypothetical protein